MSLLHPSVRYLIEARLGWRDLRPAQRAAFEPIARGDSFVLVAPTSGGKTEAAILPLLSRALSEDWKPVSIVYVAPLKALLNDLAERLSALSEAVGLRADAWHGDVAEPRRRRIVRDPPDILLATPESLEALLSFARDARRCVLAAVRVLVVDEVHVFFGSARGTQLLALAERLARYAAHDVQRIGLSATVGNPDDLARYLAGSSATPMTVSVTARAARRERFRVRYVPERSAIAATFDDYRDGKTVVFCPGRRDVEELTRALLLRGFDAWPHHSAIAAGARREAEDAFRDARAGVLVATSTLELGIDIGDLDQAVQLDAPPTVSALVQRLGRTGRRAGRFANLDFVVRSPEKLLLALSLLRLHAAGWIEPLAAVDKPWLVLVQQILAHVLQGGGLPRAMLTATLRSNAALATFSAEDLNEVVDALLASSALEETDGRVLVGPAAERRFAARHFGELSSVFVADDSVEVVSERGVIGSVQRWYVEGIAANPGAVFLLAGTPWVIRRYDAQAKTVDVRPADHANAPIFLGGEVELSDVVCGAVRAITAGEADVLPPDTAVDEAAEAVLREVRRSVAALRLAEPGMVLAVTGVKPRLLTYAGLRANRVIASCCEKRGIRIAATSNVGVTFALPLRTSEVCELFRAPWSVDSLRDAIADAPIPVLSPRHKITTLVPASVQDRIARTAFFDVQAAAAVIASGIRESAAAT